MSLISRLFTRCVSRQDGPTDDQGSSAAPTPAGSEYHIPGPATATETVPPSKLNRAQTIKKYVTITDDISFLDKLLWSWY